MRTSSNILTTRASVIRKCREISITIDRQEIKRTGFGSADARLYDQLQALRAKGDDLEREYNQIHQREVEEEHRKMREHGGYWYKHQYEA